MVSTVHDSLGKKGEREIQREIIIIPCVSSKESIPRKGDVCAYVCVPLALEGEDGEERITGFFRLLLGL